ncbi:MAG TPA: hypothetical protein VF890_02525 [Gemmatimonadales bacterium]
MNSNRLLLRRLLPSLALPVAMTAAVLSCADPSPVSIDPQGLTAQRVVAHGLISCTPLPYDSVTKVIGPGGGWLVVGGHVLIVDSLALTSPVSITAVAASDTLNLVRLQPEGLRFKPGTHGIGALLATNLDNCTVHPNQVLHVAHVSDSLAILDFLQSPTGSDSVVVTKYKTYLGSLWIGGLLRHFSNYAVAW